MTSLRQVQAKCAVYVNVYYHKVIVRGWEVVLLGGIVHVSTAEYGLMYSTVKPRFTIHWNMKYGDKVPCTSHVLFRKLHTKVRLEKTGSKPGIVCCRYYNVFTSVVPMFSCVLPRIVRGTLLNYRT